MAVCVKKIPKPEPDSKPSLWRSRPSAFQLQALAHLRHRQSFRNVAMAYYFRIFPLTSDIFAQCRFYRAKKKIGFLTPVRNTFSVLSFPPEISVCSLGVPPGNFRVSAAFEKIALFSLPPEMSYALRRQRFRIFAAAGICRISAADRSSRMSGAARDSLYSVGVHGTYVKYVLWSGVGEVVLEGKTRGDRRTAMRGGEGESPHRTPVSSMTIHYSNRGG